MSNLRILISGGGIAGPAAAFFLAQAGADITIVERAPDVRSAGQNIDIRGAAREVIRLMGLEEELSKHHTTEKGMMWVDSDDKCVAPFPATQEGEAESFTAELEILRSDLAKILYEATKEKAKWVFNDYVSGIEELGNKVKVTLAKGDIQEYDIVIAADGLGSKTRSLAIPEFGEQWINRTGMYMAFFSCSKTDDDGDWCKWFIAPGRRSTLVRPDNHGGTRVVLAAMNGDPQLEKVLSQPQSEQKALMRKTFKDAGWRLNRLLDGMDTSTDFYMDKIAQTRMPFWSRGRVVLLGDAGYAPSPITGMGTSLALMGAYILAGEISQSPKDIQQAFSAYDRTLRPVVEKAQKLFPGSPGILHPETAWGVKILYIILSIASWGPLRNTVMKFSGPPAKEFQLPKYNLGKI